MGKMVETITYNINDLERKNHDEFINAINVTDDIDFCSRNLSAESEFHRILVHLGGNDPEVNKRGYQIIPYYFTLDVGKNVENRVWTHHSWRTNYLYCNNWHPSMMVLHLHTSGGLMQNLAAKRVTCTAL